MLKKRVKSLVRTICGVFFVVGLMTSMLHMISEADPINVGWFIGLLDSIGVNRFHFLCTTLVMMFAGMSLPMWVDACWSDDDDEDDEEAEEDEEEWLITPTNKH